MKPQTPVLNQAAIRSSKPSGPPPSPAPPGSGSPEEREDAGRERIRRERVADAVEFGAALQDLVAYTHQVAEDQLRQSESGAAPRTSGLRFPPDLLVSLHPTANLRRARQTLLKLEPKLLKESEEKEPEEKKLGGKGAEGSKSGMTGHAGMAGKVGSEGSKSGTTGHTGMVGKVGTDGAKSGATMHTVVTGGMKPGEKQSNGSKAGAMGHQVKTGGTGSGQGKAEEKKPGETQQQKVLQYTEEAKQAEEQAKQARKQAEQAKQRARQAWQQAAKAEQVEQAEQLAEQAEQQAEQAEQRAEQARQRAEQAERQQQAEKRVEQQIKEAQQKADQADQRTKKAQQKADQADKRARMAEQKADQAEQRALPSKGLGIEEKFTEEYIRNLMGAQGAQGENGSPDNASPSLADLYDATCLWNDCIVERLVDYPTVLSGYRVGKALTYTQWQIEEADGRWKRENGNLSADPWNKAFDKQRIDEIQRHIGSLSTVLDSRAVAAVSTGLDYWRDALLYLSSAEKPPAAPPAQTSSSMSARSQPAQPSAQEEEPIAIPRAERDQLLQALEEQIDDWMAVLTEQRPPESFPVPGIVTALTKKVAANAWARVFRVVLPFIVILLIVVGLVAAGLLLFGNVSNLSTVLGGLGSVVVGVLSALFAARGQASPGHGPGAVGGGGGMGGVGMGGYGMGGYGMGGGGMGGGSSWRAGYGAGAAIGNVAASLKEDVFTDVVEQLRLEELNLAINDPLIRCVLSLKGQATGDPQEDAERFLQLVYKDQSNLQRLQPVFKELYRY